ncbi:MAG: helix-turn-helix transcriptional regulator [Caldilineaceae bacterium]|nr:helix-turn-helix transcriptional regulator [Caldilineaceae bacterium]
MINREFTIELTPSQAGCCAPPVTLRWNMAEAEELAAMLKALANPVRLQMVELLSRLGGEVCVCDIEAQFDLAQPTISHHLKVLRQAKLIDCEPRGVWIYYYTRPEAISRLRMLMGDLSGSGAA